MTTRDSYIKELNELKKYTKVTSVETGDIFVLDKIVTISPLLCQVQIHSDRNVNITLDITNKQLYNLYQKGEMLAKWTADDFIVTYSRSLSQDNLNDIELTPSEKLRKEIYPETFEDNRMFSLVYGNGYDKPGTQKGTIERFTEDNGFDEKAISLVNKLQVGESVDLSKFEGHKTGQLVVTRVADTLYDKDKDMSKGENDDNANESFTKFADFMTGQAIDYRGIHPITIVSVQEGGNNEHGGYVISTNEPQLKDFVVSVSQAEETLKIFSRHPNKLGLDGIVVICEGGVEFMMFQPKEPKDEKDSISFTEWRSNLVNLIKRKAKIEENEISLNENEIKDYYNEGKSTDEVYHKEWGEDAGHFYGINLTEDKNDIPKLGIPFFTQESDGALSYERPEGGNLIIEESSTGRSVAMFFKRKGQRQWTSVGVHGGVFSSFADAIDELNELGGKRYIESLLK